MAFMSFKCLCLLPLLFVSGYAQLFPDPFFKQEANETAEEDPSVPGGNPIDENPVGYRMNNNAAVGNPQNNKAAVGNIQTDMKRKANKPKNNNVEVDAAIETDTWCSSGGLTIEGNLVGTGGYMNGAKTLRFLDTCDKCDWREYPAALADPRWYVCANSLFL
ncbi:hypothetical protein Dsin_015377 [Dipteronia sinensis]|uniref:Glyoxal oxidase N-terminal domain-containing protein n=1 Tax=Dipteronia sinensis TaxID=43782 RepID=A0AAE0AB40_9ROSI|nr:hypothetical protein Dsin_015377 [Dipteronia sinensis]